MSAPSLFKAKRIVDGDLLELSFIAPNEDEARRHCSAVGYSFHGVTTVDDGRARIPIRFAYPEDEARVLLGGISRSTLNRWLADGKIKRVPGTASLLVTHSSIEDRENWQPKQTGRRPRRG